MSITISAAYINKNTFSLTDSNGNESTRINDSRNQSVEYTYGSGDNQVTNATSVTGILASGGSTQIDLQAISQRTFNGSQSISFTGIKNITVYNQSSAEGYDCIIAATGSNACTNLFNGESGNLIIKPLSDFSYNDPFTGVEVSASQRYLYLNDQGSGVTYKVMILGLD